MLKVLFRVSYNMSYKVWILSQICFLLFVCFLVQIPYVVKAIQELKEHSVKVFMIIYKS